MYCVAHNYAEDKNNIHSGCQQNPDRFAWLRLDCGWDWTPDPIGLDWTGIFAFCAKELCREKLFSMMTQVARNKKSEFPQQESNL